MLWGSFVHIILCKEKKRVSTNVVSGRECGGNTK